MSMEVGSEVLCVFGQYKFKNMSFREPLSVNRNFTDIVI